MPKKKNFLGGMQNYNPKTGEYESRLTKADGEPATKENMPGGESSKVSNKSFSKFGKKTDEGGTKAVSKNKELVKTDEYGLFDEESIKEKEKFLKEKGITDVVKLSNKDFNNLAKEAQERFGIEDFESAQEFLVSESKNKNKKPTDFEGVEETKYGYIYNVGNTSITDLKEERKAMGMKVDDEKDYGFSVFKNGEEVFYDTFEKAYKSTKRKDDTFGKNKETSSNKYNLKPSKEIRRIKMGSLSQEIGSTYNHLSDFYGVDLDELVYGEGGFMKTQYPYNFPDFRGDVVHSPKYWDEFEKWAKEEKGVDFTDRAWERYKLDPDYFEYNNSRNFVKEIREYGKKVEPNHPILKKERVDYGDLPF